MSRLTTVRPPNSKNGRGGEKLEREIRDGGTGVRVEGTLTDSTIIIIIRPQYEETLSKVLTMLWDRFFTIEKGYRVQTVSREV